MSKLQKSYPNYTHVCILAEPGRCLYTVPLGTPLVSPPLGAPFLCWHQTSLGEYAALTPRYWFSYLPAYYRGGVAKGYEAKNACLLHGQNLDYQSPDKISGNRRDSDTHTTGPTLTTVAPAFEG